MADAISIIDSLIVSLKVMSRKVVRIPLAKDQAIPSTFGRSSRKGSKLATHNLHGQTVLVRKILLCLEDAGWWCQSNDLEILAKYEYDIIK